LPATVADGGIRVDLNADLGEGIPDEVEEQLFTLVTSANIACGGHAGDGDSMLAACGLAVACGVAIGAHPSYEDRDGFGRRESGAQPREIAEVVARQLDRLAEAAAACGGAVAHVKPHGALYHRIEHDREAAVAFGESVAGLLPGAALVGTPSSVLVAVAGEVGLPYVSEGFADRGYTSDGRLVERGLSGAVLGPVEAARQSLALIGTGTPAQGMPQSAVDTICIHGDGDDAVAVARAVRDALEGAGARIEARR